MLKFTLPPRSQLDLGWNAMRHALADATTTPYGREQALELGFLPDKAAVELSLGRIEEMRALHQDGVRLPLGSASDVRPSIARALKHATLSASEVVLCARLMQDGARLRQFARGRESVLPCLTPLLEAFGDHSDLAADIDMAIEPSGSVRDHASPALEQARSRVQQLQRQLAERIEVYLHDPSFAAHLQDQYFSVRADRYVLPIVAQARNHVPGIVHNTSNTGHTVFIEPAELIPLGNELAIQLAAVREEERRILAMFSQDIGERAQALVQSTAQIGQLDTLVAAAHIAAQTGAHSPQVVAATEHLHLLEVRHPRLVLAAGRVVPNRVSLPAPAQVLVISGPNAGGKTVSLTAAGLCALMVRAGLPIPASPASRVPLYHGVHCAIGDAQDLKAGLSSFSAHLTVLREILAQARTGWLVLIDEIGADTDPQEGAALGQASLEALVHAGAHVLVTTHFDDIKALGVISPHFANAKVGFDAASLTPTYTLEMGTAGVSCALDVAEQMGLPDAVLKAARSHLHHRGALSEALGKLAAAHDGVHAERQALAQQRDELAQLRRQLAADAQMLAQARQRAHTDIYESLAGEIESARAEVQDQLTRLRQTPSRSAADRLEAQLAQMAASARQSAERAVVVHPEPAAQGALTKGAWVRIVPLGQVGQIEQIDGSRLVVRVGALKSRVRRDHVVLTHKPQATQAKARRAAAPADALPGAVQHTASRCDVRGMRFDEAERVLERALDACLSDGQAALWIVHGLGTGALRQGIHEYLSHSPYVASMRAAQEHEGGEAITIVSLRQ